MHIALLVNNMAPPTVLIAQNDEEKDKQIAKLKTACEDYEKKAKAMDEEHEKMEAKLAAQDPNTFQEPGPVVKAIIAGMDEDHKEDAKARIAKLIAQEDDEEKKASLIKAQKEIFDTGNGVNTNAKSAMDEEHDKEQTATLAKLSAHYTKPLIAKILQAKAIAGASSASLEAEEKVLSAMKLPDFEALYANQEIFINQAIESQDAAIDSALSAKTIEAGFDFNGASLIGKTVDIDAAREAVNQ